MSTEQKFNVAEIPEARNFISSRTLPAVTLYIRALLPPLTCVNPLDRQQAMCRASMLCFLSLLFQICLLLYKISRKLAHVSVEGIVVSVNSTSCAALTAKPKSERIRRSRVKV